MPRAVVPSPTLRPDIFHLLLGVLSELGCVVRHEPKQTIRPPHRIRPHTSTAHLQLRCIQDPAACNLPLPHPRIRHKPPTLRYLLRHFPKGNISPPPARSRPNHLHVIVTKSVHLHHQLRGNSHRPTSRELSRHVIKQQHAMLETPNLPPGLQGDEQLMVNIDGRHHGDAPAQSGETRKQHRSQRLPAAVVPDKSSDGSRHDHDPTCHRMNKNTTTKSSSRPTHSPQPVHQFRHGPLNE